MTKDGVIAKAFRHFGIDPDGPNAKDDLLQAMLQALEPVFDRRSPGRPPEWPMTRIAELFEDTREIVLERIEKKRKLELKEIADELIKRHPHKKYGSQKKKALRNHLSSAKFQKMRPEYIGSHLSQLAALLREVGPPAESGCYILISTPAARSAKIDNPVVAIRALPERGAK